MNGNYQTAQGFINIEGQSFANKLRAPILVLNPRGVAGSEGSSRTVSSKGLVRDAEAALQYLESQKHVKEIITWGWSLGGGILGEALSRHKFHPQIKYQSVFDRTFTKLSTESGEILTRKIKSQRIRHALKGILSFVVKRLGWELETLSGANNGQHQTIFTYTDYDEMIGESARTTDENLKSKSIKPLELNSWQASHTTPLDTIYDWGDKPFGDLDTTMLDVIALRLGISNIKYNPSEFSN